MPADAKTDAESQQSTSDTLINAAISLCGGLAILGVFSKLNAEHDFGLLVQIGFYGEAAAFGVMAVRDLMGLMGSAPSSSTTPSSLTSSEDGLASPPMQSASGDMPPEAVLHGDAGDGAALVPTPAGTARAGVASEAGSRALRPVVIAHPLSDEEEELAQVVSEAKLELEGVRQMASSLRPALKAMDSGRLQSSCDALADEVEAFTNSMRGSRGALETTQGHLEAIRERFAAFQQAGSAGNAEGSETLETDAGETSSSRG